MTDMYEYAFHVKVHIKQMGIDAERDVLIREKEEPTDARIGELIDMLLTADNEEVRVDSVVYLFHKKLKPKSSLPELDQL